MKLRSPTPTGTVSQAENSMQHVAAMRVQARIEGDEQRRRRAESAKTFAAVFKVVGMLGVLLLLLWCWRSGLLDSVLDRKDSECQKKLGDLFEAPPKTVDGSPAPKAGDGAPVAKESSVLERLAQSARDLKDRVTKASSDESAPPSSAARFVGATLDYWKNAVAEDRPGKEKRLSFAGLVPDGRGGFTFLDLEMGGGQPLAVRILGPDGSYMPVDKSAFNKLIAQTPYLVAREGRAYFCSAGQAKAPDAYPVPPKDGVFNPAREEFGALMDCLAQVKVRPPAAMYRVTLVLEKLKKEIPVATVGYGATVSRSVFEGAVRSLVDDADAVQMLLKSGKVRFSAAK